MKKIINDSLVLFGMIFLILIVFSYFTKISDLVENGKTYLVILFLAIIIGRYIKLKLSSRKHSKA
ncbi:hypothetical protein [Listeria booriae]|uniref:Uncharacterized protein n=1 Tax=Listeria booriae TaxID=1552123 RepID=A0A7X0TP93_9LIST|nr:hypothetical protein [Listeria booriae]MBC1332497.1 hypothetical protein [Listeria booriae]MBC2387897.1 hypothetical protein [Listeria booriae]